MTEAAREANERIAIKALRLHFLARVPFICECSDPGCREFILLLPQQYADPHSGGNTYLTVSGHQIIGAEPVVADGYWFHTRRSA